MSLRQKLHDVFVETLDIDGEVDVEHLEYRDISNWDSVGHMTLVTAIEDTFDVQLETGQVLDMSSFKVAFDMLREMGVPE